MYLTKLVSVIESDEIALVIYQHLQPMNGWCPH